VSGNRGEIERRVARAADASLAEHKFVSAIDVLVGLGWLEPRRVDAWRQGRVDYLERVVGANLGKISTAMHAFGRWARERGLGPSETAYVARTRDRRPLRFSKSGDLEIERAYRTHWVSPELSERKQARMAERAGSRLSAVVVRFSRARRRYERQGILVEERALERAEQECLADEQARERRRVRDAERRAGEDLELSERMAREIVRLFPGCPAERAQSIALHTSVRGSGRVGRSAAGRGLDPTALELAVAAAVRHEDTRYDELLMRGVERELARTQVRDEVARVVDSWRP